MTQAYDDKSGDSYIQHLLLPADSKDIRLPLDWDKLKDVGVDRDEWKVLSFVRVKPFWIEPNLTTIATHPHLASHLTLLNSPDKKTTLAIYPVSTLSVNNVLVFEDGGLKANLQRVVPSESPDEEKVWVICAEATSEIEQRRLVNKVVNLARGLVGGQADKTNELDSAYPRGNGADAVKGNGKEELWDGLGICTWESLLQEDGERARPTKDNLLSLIPSPDEIPIKSFLIDDGWQDTIVNPVDRRLVSFAPWDGFGGPLKDVVSAIKAKGVEKVGVWLTLQGYWEGIHPDSPLVQKYECREYKKKKSKGGLENEGPNEGEEERVILLPTPEKAGAFWEDHIKELKNAGIDFIKCDNQAESNYAYDPEGFHIQQALWSAMLDAVERHLGTDNVIMCMSHNERMLNGPGGLDFDVPPGNLVFRNSDDFAMNYANTHVDHLYINVFNTVLTSQLSLVPDFDMFASSPSDLLPTYHALLRSLGPGPILLSDTPRTESNVDLISMLTAQTRNGKHRAVRAQRPVQALSHRWFDTIKGSSDGGALVGGSLFDENLGGIIGLWNVHDYTSNATAKDQVPWRDIADLMDLNDWEDEKAEAEYVLSTPLALSKYAKNQSTNLVLLGPHSAESMDVVLEKGECEMVVVSRLHTIGVGKVRVGIVGLKDKFASLSGITDIRIDEENDSIKFNSIYFARSISMILIENNKDKFPISLKGFIDDRECELEIREVDVRDGKDTLRGLLVDLVFPLESVDSLEKGLEDEGDCWKVELRLEFW